MFDDELVIFFKDDGNWIVKKYQITTDPGRHYLKNPMEKTGTAILCTGQYKGMFKLGKHRGRYDALVQARPVRVYRDNDRDDELDMNVNITETGMFGINMHRSSPYSKSYTVEKWSAGCQVFASSSQYNQFMRLIKISAKKYGQFFSYTLLGEADFY